jgi:hypothetical protein
MMMDVILFVCGKPARSYFLADPKSILDDVTPCGRSSYVAPAAAPVKMDLCG